MGTTPNNAFPYPEATGLVKDGWEDIKDLATSIDTKLGVFTSSALTKINTTTFSAVSSVSLPNNTFTSTYLNYLVILTITNSTSNGGPVDLRMRGRSSGTDLTTADYYFNYKAARQDGSNTDRTDNAQTSTLIGRTGTGIPKQTYVINVSDPLDQKVFSGFGFGMAANGTFENSIMGGKINVGGSAADSLSFISTTNVITGTVRTYAYVN